MGAFSTKALVKAGEVQKSAFTSHEALSVGNRISVPSGQGHHFGFHVALECFGSCEVPETVVVRSLESLRAFVEQ